MDRFAFNAQMGVAPGGWATGGRAVFGADINAAGEADPAIADHDFAVSAKIDVVGPQPAQAERIEPGGLAARITHRLQKAITDPVRADSVQQQPHLDAGPSLFDQYITQPDSNGIWLPEIVFEMNVVASGSDGRFQR